jgi:adenosylhomocysteine nucleosidase
MAILFVAAEAAELKFLAGQLINLRKLKWPIDYAEEGILQGRRILLAANGAGPALAAQAVEVAKRAVKAAELSASRLEAIVSTGFCGALVSAYRENQIIVGTEVIDGATGERYTCGATVEADCPRGEGPIVSQNRIALNSAEKQTLSECGAIAVDMESVGVAVQAKRAGLPFCCIKVVSDRVDESFKIDLNAMRTTAGRIARGKIVLNAVTHPGLLPELFFLRRRTQEAAKALGEFLVSCRISLSGDGSTIE